MKKRKPFCSRHDDKSQNGSGKVFGMAGRGWRSSSPRAIAIRPRNKGVSAERQVWGEVASLERCCTWGQGQAGCAGRVAITEAGRRARLSIELTPAPNAHAITSGQVGKARQQKSACWERVLGPGRTWCSHGWVARNASRSRHPAIDNPAVGCMQQIAAQQQHKEMRVQVRWEAEGQHSMGLGKGSRASPSTSDARAASESEAAPHQHSPKSTGR